MPMPGAYWLAPASSAASAAATTDAGPSTSGNPWPRLSAPVRTARADISLKTVGGMWARRRDSGETLMSSNIASLRSHPRSIRKALASQGSSRSM